MTAATAALLFAGTVQSGPTAVRAAPLSGLPAYSHVAVLVLENESEPASFGPGSPAHYLRSLVAQGTFDPNYYGTGHASLDNYVAMLSGQPDTPLTGADCAGVSLYVCANQQAYPQKGHSLVDQLQYMGLSWKGYMDGMPSPCFHAPYSPTSTKADPYQGNSTKPPARNYADRHNPFNYFPDIVGNDARCRSHVLPYPQLAADLSADALPAYSFISPDTCHDGHDTPCAGGEPGGLVSADAWLSQNVPALLAYMQAHNGLLLLTFDEGATSDVSGCCAGGPAGLTRGFGGRVGLIALGAHVRPGVTITTAYDHMSQLRTIGDIFGVPDALNNAEVTPPMTDLFASTSTGAAPFSVGAAVASYTPPCGQDGTAAATGCTPAAAGFVDPASCVAPPGYTGRRLFAFEEPYVDQGQVGHYVLGDAYVDCNGDGRWDGNFIGGGSSTPRFYDHVADQVGARAMVASNGGRTIAVEVLDHEGAFNVYLAAIRSLVGQMLPPGASLRPEDVYISSTHDESAPDSIGLYGVAAVVSSANPYWVAYMEQKAARAVVDAYLAMRPATITYAEAIEPATFRQCFSSYPFVDDQAVPTLRAVDAATGRVIVTLADVSQHAETLGFNGGSATDPGAPTPTTLEQEKRWLSADWPFWFRHRLETDQGGGVAIEMAGSVGSNETPQVFPTPVSRTPQQFVDASHPAGCRTTYVADESTMVPLGYYSEDVALGTQLAAAVESALQAGSPSLTNDIEGSRRTVCLQDTNALFAVAGAAGVFGARPAYADPACTVPVPVPPTGTAAAAYIQTQVAGFRIGDGTFVSIPGEVFPFTYLRSFLGPQDMPCPDPNPKGSCGGPPAPTLTCAKGKPYPLPPWLMPHMHTPYRFINGLGEDMVGYIFPCGNGIGVPGEYPKSNPQANGTDRFGCGHSDDSEAASSNASDDLGAAAVTALDTLEGASAPAENIVAGRYVLPGGTLSRDPLGGPGSIGCHVNMTFTASGPATAVHLANGTTLVPAQWMSLSGRPQPGGPDRNTRGYIDGAGGRHWLDVFPDM